MRTLTVLIACLLLSTALQAQSVSYQDRLYYTCKVWGLLKYHHSEVSQCRVDWDEVLRNTLPDIKAAESRDDFNDVLLAMYHLAGPMELPTSEMPQVPEEFILNRDVDWLQDTALRDDLRDSLQVVLDHFRPHAICHVKENRMGSWLSFPTDNPHLNVTVSEDFPDEPDRLLCMFTYWNILAWFNPNAGILDVPWDSTLHRTILEVAEADDAEAFYDSYRHMASGLDDAHVNGRISWSGHAYEVYGLKIILGWTSEGYTVLKSDVPEISVGDVLRSVDGTSVAQLEEQLRPLMSSGNESVFRRDFCTRMLMGGYYMPIEAVLENPDRGEYTYTGTRNYAMTSSWHADYYPCDSLADVHWTVLDGGIGYVHMGNLVTDDVPAMYRDLRDLPAIIFDVRNYPRGTADEIADAMLPYELDFVRFLLPNVTYPGTYIELALSAGNDGNPNAYNGKVIILCNENTQSHAEYSCMYLRAMPGSVIVGSQTAGADGNISYWNLTQDISAGYTSLGVYWPDGGNTQRIGIVPDSVVIPSQRDIIAGRDAVLEKALAIAGVTVAAEAPPLARDMTLEQNFPNPFNPATSIRFSIPHAGHVRLVVTDLLGRHVETLLDERRQAGAHMVTWDAGTLPSGSYRYALEADGQTLSRIMLFTK